MHLSWRSPFHYALYEAQWNKYCKMVENVGEMLIMNLLKYQ